MGIQMNQTKTVETVRTMGTVTGSSRLNFFCFLFDLLIKRLFFLPAVLSVGLFTLTSLSGLPTGLAQEAVGGASSAPGEARDGTSAVETGHSTVVFQLPGLDSEGVRPTLMLSVTTDQGVVEALDTAYGTPEAARGNNLPKQIQVMVPDTMSEREAQEYLEEKRQILSASKVAREFEIELVLRRIPVKALEQQIDRLEKETAAAVAAEPERVHERSRFFAGARAKIIAPLKQWAHGLSQRKRWNPQKWNPKNMTIQQKDQAVATIFGVVRGIPGVIALWADAHGAVFNVLRMAVSWSADIFFSAFAQKVEKFKAEYRLSFFGKWFNNNKELKAFLFNYSLSMAFPWTSATLGQLAKGGQGGGDFDPLKIADVAQLGALQLINSTLGTFGGRGIRTMAAKGYISGRMENLIYQIFNILGKSEELLLASQQMGLYTVVMTFKSALLGLVYLVSRILPVESPNVYLFHPSIRAQDRDSLLYVKGTLVSESNRLESLDQLESAMKTAAPGANAVNRFFAHVGEWLKDLTWFRVERKEATLDRAALAEPLPIRNEDKEDKSVRAREETRRRSSTAARSCRDFFQVPSAAGF